MCFFGARKNKLEEKVSFSKSTTKACKRVPSDNSTIAKVQHLDSIEFLNQKQNRCRHRVQCFVQVISQIINAKHILRFKTGHDPTIDKINTALGYKYDIRFIHTISMH